MWIYICKRCDLPLEIRYGRQLYHTECSVEVRREKQNKYALDWHKRKKQNADLDN